MASFKRIMSWALVLMVVSTFSYGAGKYSEIKALILDDVNIVVEGQAQLLKNTEVAIFTRLVIMDVFTCPFALLLRF